MAKYGLGCQAQVFQSILERGRCSRHSTAFHLSGELWNTSPTYRCLPQWAHQNKGQGALKANHNWHLKTHPYKAIVSYSQSPVVSQWTQRVEIGAGKSKSHKPTGDIHCFTFPLSTLPPLVPEVLEPLFPSTNDVTPSTQKWARLLGWEDYIVTPTCQGSDCSKVVAKLQNLVALPSKAQVAKTKNKVAQTLEQGLLLYPTYLTQCT